LPILHFYIPYKNFRTEKTKHKQASATVFPADQIHIGATTEKHAIPTRPATAINAAGGRCLSPLVAPRLCSGPERPSFPFPLSSCGCFPRRLGRVKSLIFYLPPVAPTPAFLD
jgi:hypothetical protein